MVSGLEQNGLVNNNSVSGRRKKSGVDMIQDEQREKQILPDPFSNTILLGPKDWIVLGLGTIFLLPLRVVGVVASLCTAWFVAKIGLFGLPEEDVHSCLAKRSPWRVKLMEWYAIFGRLVFWSAGLNIHPAFNGTV